MNVFLTCDRPSPSCCAVRTSETRVRSNAEIEDQLEDAIVSFYETAQASTGTKPKYAAVQGALKLLSAQISAVLLQPGRETTQASSFVVCCLSTFRFFSQRFIPLPCADHVYYLPLFFARTGAVHEQFLGSRGLLSLRVQ